MLQNRDIDAVIIANGNFPTSERALQIVRNAPLVVCCDGAADNYIAQGEVPDIIIGDGDSLSEQNRVRFAQIIHYNPDQQTNDQTKAVQYLLDKGLKRIAIVGATGKREDHTIGNIALLIEYLRSGAEVRSYTDYGVFIPCKGECSFDCIKGAQVSIFNINAKNISSKGLDYQLYDFDAWWQGTLNQASEESFTIEAEGEYIVYITYDKRNNF